MQRTLEHRRSALEAGAIGALPVVRVDNPHSKVHPIRDSLRMIVDLAVIRRNDVREALWGGA